jgi:hypothetical protein
MSHDSVVKGGRGIAPEVLTCCRPPPMGASCYETLFCGTHNCVSYVAKYMLHL